MSTSLSDLKPILKLFAAERKRGLLLGAAMSAATVGAGIACLVSPAGSSPQPRSLDCRWRRR
jgi:hypothetical protein